MRKSIHTAFYYFLAAMAAGVFYREFTKFMGFDGITYLGKVHTHFMALGVLVFLLVALFAKDSHLTSQKSFSRFYLLYNIGLPLAGITMLVRGILQVQGIVLSKGMDAAISGFSGIGHILLFLGFWMLFSALKKEYADQ